jgi:hypothetical protein
MHQPHLPWDPGSLLEVIQRERQYGRVILDLVSLETALMPVNACNIVVRHANLKVPPQWVNLPATGARLHLVRCLSHDLAHNVECMSECRAEELANAFISLFADETSHYFTNTLPFIPLVYERYMKASESGLVVITENEVAELEPVIDLCPADSACYADEHDTEVVSE